jgi:predicted TIM-barrel fold metal-dependent hydrolase
MKPHVPASAHALALLPLILFLPLSVIASDQSPPEGWRSGRLLIDLHQHIDCTTQHLARAVKIMDAAGLGTAVNLSGGTVTRAGTGSTSEFEQNKQLADALYPGRFVHYMNLDYAGWDEADFSERAVKQVEEGHRLGAAGLKEFKQLGLFLRDGSKRLLRVDDAKLDPVWLKCGELGMPVSIHVADPKAFWLPYNEHNERWKELKDHPAWWFGDTNKYPAWKDLLESLNRVIARHPKTIFVCVHFGNNAEELEWVDAALARYPNMMVDLAARIPELGRHDPAAVRRFFLKHQDRIFFATDFQVYDRLILGSSGNEPPPTDADAEVFFLKEYRWLETTDRNWAHMTPIQGDWKISSIGLPTPVLRKVYFDNARKLLARSLPVPAMRARHISQDFDLNGSLDYAAWETANPVFIEQQAVDGSVVPKLSTPVRALWSDRFLYIAYECPFTKLTVFPGPMREERFDLKNRGVSLWDRDVVEAFIGEGSASKGRYSEFEVAPSNERLDIQIDLPRKDFAWKSGFESAVKIDQKKRVWTCEMRIPWEALAGNPPTVGSVRRLNLFRCDRANKAFMAWRPPLTGTFHTPDRFGLVQLAD